MRSAVARAADTRPREPARLLMTGISGRHRYMIQQLSLAIDWVTGMGAAPGSCPPTSPDLW